MHRILERIGIDDRKGGVAVEVGEVADLVGNRPTGARGRQLPLVRRQRGDDCVERLLFGSEIGEYLGHVHG